MGKLSTDRELRKSDTFDNFSREKKELKQRKLNGLSLVRPIYRTLLNKGRTYAAFNEEKVFPLVEKLANRKVILDPMSGYGSLMLYCSKIGIKGFCLELSSPLYLWHVLNHPANLSLLEAATGKLLSLKMKWPRSSLKATVSNDWFPNESKRIIVKLLDLTRSLLEGLGQRGKKNEELSLALILPFVGRLSSSIPGDVTEVKKGGICVYKDFHDDLTTYLQAVQARLYKIEKESQSDTHTVWLGDCRTIKLPRRRFAAMITSPPYPNHRDFFSIFAPENNCLSWLNERNLINLHPSSRLGIGTNVVSRRTIPVPKSKTIRRFLENLRLFKDSKRPKASYDNRVYYIPYFSNYFHDLEKTYENIEPSFRKDFDGYIVVVNNTTRDQVIPVAESTVETWKRLGFKTEITDVQEKFHIGTKNPRARGFKAKHKEYTIRIWRK